MSSAPKGKPDGPQQKGVKSVVVEEPVRKRKPKVKVSKEERLQVVEKQMNERMQEKYGLDSIKDANAVREAYELIKIRRGQVDRDDFIQRRKAKS